MLGGVNCQLDDSQREGTQISSKKYSLISDQILVKLTGDPKLWPISWANANFDTVVGNAFRWYAKFTIPVFRLSHCERFGSSASMKSS